ncbi:potassium channel subfamily K member 18-like [Ptychodera flava]|uniref:potassium channel subfamily K member 18-like n=1 Tax=Ptychodera flava TaxID=63121 RepID=UPI00396A92B6
MTIRRKTVLECQNRVSSKVWGCLILTVIVTGYLILGTYIFHELEGTLGTPNEAQRNFDAILANVTQQIRQLCDLKSDNFSKIAKDILGEFQHMAYKAEQGPTGPDLWTWSATSLFCVTVLTTIGYGFMAPVTVAGRMFCIFYAMIGIPLNLLFLSSAGDVIAMPFRYAVVRLKYIWPDRKYPTLRSCVERRPQPLEDTSAFAVKKADDEPSVSSISKHLESENVANVVLELQVPSCDNDDDNLKNFQSYNMTHVVKCTCSKFYAIDDISEDKESKKTGRDIPDGETELSENGNQYKIATNNHAHISLRGDIASDKNNVRHRSIELDCMNTEVSVYTPSVDSSCSNTEVKPSICETCQQRKSSSCFSALNSCKNTSSELLTCEMYIEERKHTGIQTDSLAANTQHNNTKENDVPLSVVGIIVLLYIFVGAKGFQEYEDWPYLDSLYFCVITLTTIGFGDIEPSQDFITEEGNCYITMAYIMIGLVILSVCFNLSQKKLMKGGKSMKNCLIGSRKEQPTLDKGDNFDHSV